MAKDARDRAGNYLRAVMKTQHLELFDMVTAVIEEAKLAVRVECGDGTQALVLLAESGDMTLYRIRDATELEVFSFGQLTSGVLLETLEVAGEYPQTTQTVSIVYESDALAAVGGRFTVTEPGDFEDVRVTLLPFVGARPG